MKTTDDFKEILGAVHIKECGQLSHDFNGLNYSSILTKLIQEAGRWCKSYASDLFIDWYTIYKQIEEQQLKNGSYLFGFREYGVDHDNFIFHRYEQHNASHEYRAIWRLDITVDEDAYPSSDMVAVLFDLYEVAR